MRSRRPALAALVTTTLLLGSAVPASAAVEVQDWGDVLDVRAYGAADLRIRCEAGRIHLETDTFGDGYSQCDRVERIQVLLQGSGGDRVELEPYGQGQFPALRGITVDARPDGARDELSTGWGADYVIGDGADAAYTGAGDDHVAAETEGPGEVFTAEGNDKIESGFVFDSFAGPSNVRFESRVVDGGPGYDTWSAVLQLRDPVIVLNSSGLVSGSRRMAVRGIETATLTVSNGPVDFNAEQFGGNLVLATGDGNDRVVGTPAYDSISSRGGDDWVWVRDGVADQVDCGPGTDTVVADVADVVTGCETVTLPAPPPPPPGTPTPVPSPPVPGTPVPPPGTPGTPGTPGAPGGPVLPETGEVKGKKKVAKPRRAKFRFSSPTPGATFECKVDRRSWNPCAAPYRVATKQLKKGKHLFRVRAVLGGTVDPTPSRLRFRVTRRGR